MSLFIPLAAAFALVGFLAGIIVGVVLALDTSEDDSGE